MLASWLPVIDPRGLRKHIHQDTVTCNLLSATGPVHFYTQRLVLNFKLCTTAKATCHHAALTLPSSLGA